MFLTHVKILNMVACNQCGKPAVVAVGDNPLCVDCYSKFQQAVRQQDIMMKEHYNRVIGDAEALTGMYGITPRYEIQQPVIHQGDMTFHNIKVDRSVVGSINTGNVERIEVSLDHINQSGEEHFGSALAAFTRDVIKNADLSPEAKHEILEQLEVVTAEVAIPKERRRAGVLKSVGAGIASAVSTAADLATLWTVIQGLLR